MQTGLAVLARREVSKDAELLMVQHQNAARRRQIGQTPQPRRTGRRHQLPPRPEDLGNTASAPQTQALKRRTARDRSRPRHTSRGLPFRKPGAT
jgi:hypothetical protein